MMKDDNLKLVDVNLSRFDLDLNQNLIILEILNMNDGGEICTIKINTIIDLKYENNIDEDDILPVYIGELEISKNIDTAYYHLKMQGGIDLSITSLHCFISYPNL
ncbi:MULTISPECIES: hypothetical protein [unclassified Gilliamella]|jgi:hypothetical protein|uniref:hypothetical protein n=1 Tax=unclassified Gilliamella TaxID=2685620 RepID=UPI00080E099C|nr:hypothetical protein [Gilliamella apicola]OCG19667.1 hypothetical protein A9G47_00730 [Gilliamella apicola]OCG57443.1 hypothetical protein A9G30_01615 [Gilliamella apicola]OCG77620.1 hypothetical protein A9G42_04990 [Gilliamella apicola]